AEEAPYQSIVEMQALAGKLEVVLIVPFFEKSSTGVFYNTAAVIDADGIVLGFYRKMHIPYDPGFYEKYYFSEGDAGYKVFQTKYARIGVLICWDQWFPEAVRITALKGADIIFCPSAIGWLTIEEKQDPEQLGLDSWIVVQQGHAIANGVYVAAVNRVGPEKLSGNEQGIDFWGSSFISDPCGRLLTKASEFEPEIVYSELDFSLIENVRRLWPFFRDRRPGSYTGVLGFSHK
ncbi:nitrilase-related carbon-nitrogen hydrolase, partial [Candidatus Margulisiibacteriota bacterium]